MLEQRSPIFLVKDGREKVAEMIFDTFIMDINIDKMEYSLIYCPENRIKITPLLCIRFLHLVVNWWLFELYLHAFVVIHLMKLSAKKYCVAIQLHIGMKLLIFH